MSARERGWLRAGWVGRPHGLKGSFHVSRAAPQLLEDGNNVVIAGQTRRVLARGGTETRPIMSVEGCESAQAAKALVGEEILVERRHAPALGPDEWWPEDLEGCAVHDGDRPVGIVISLLALPSCEVLEVARDDRQGELLVPLVADAVRMVDLERRAIDVDLCFLGEE